MLVVEELICPIPQYNSGKTLLKIQWEKSISQGIVKHYSWWEILKYQLHESICPAKESIRIEKDANSLTAHKIENNAGLATSINESVNLVSTNQSVFNQTGDPMYLHIL